MAKHYLLCIRNFFLIHLAFTFLQCNAPHATELLSLKLIPWSSPESPLYPGNLTTLQKHQKIVQSSQNLEYSDNKIQIPIRHQDSYRYSVNIKIGNPSKEVALLFDTESAFVWTQCAMTSYYPKISRTYKPLPCNHQLCAKKICKCVKNQCICDVPYGSSGTRIKLAGSLDTFHIPSSHGSINSFRDVFFGCSDRQVLNLHGILGLNRSPASLLGQVKRQVGGKFSYCLHNGPSYLTIGKDISGRKIKTTPLVNIEYSTLFLNLTDISVAGTRLGLSPSLFTVRNGGVFMDTGTVYTVLAKKAYDKANKAFAGYFKRKMFKQVRGMYYNLAPCYRVSPGFSDFPSMTFHFQNADMVSEYTHVSDGSIACTAVVRGSRTIIGALQQWNTRFMFDVSSNVVKFYNDKNCADDT